MLPALALANVGVGFFFLPQPLLFVTLAPVILLEGWLIWIWISRTQTLKLRHALFWSLHMNLISTLAGAALAVLLDFALLNNSSGFEPTKTATSILLLVFLYWSWRIEYWVLRKKFFDVAQHQLLRAVLGANLASYSMLVLTVWVSPQFLSHQTLAPRVLISNVVMITKGTLSAASEDYIAEIARTPTSKELQELPAIQNLIRQAPQQNFEWLDLSSDMRLRLRLHAPGYSEIDGKILLIDFAYEGKSSRAKIGKFHCQAPSIDPRFLPLGCR